MKHWKISQSPETAKRALLDAGKGNVVLGCLGFTATDELMIQVEGDLIAIRSRAHVGNSTCPAVNILLKGEKEGTQLEVRPVLSSTGLYPVLFATLLL